MDREILEQIWPVFKAESREQLQAIGAGLLALEDGSGGDGVLTAVKRHAHSLKGSAATIGLRELEQLAHGVESLIARGAPGAGLGRDGVAAALRALAAIDAALDRGLEGGELVVPGSAELLRELAGGAPAASPPSVAAPTTPAPPPAAAPAAPPPSPLAAVLDELEARVVRLGTPGDGDRAAEIAAAVAAADRLAGADPRAAELAAPLRAALQSLADEGPARARAAVAAATLLVDLRALCDAAPAPAPVPVPAPTAVPAAAAAPEAPVARSDEAIRVRASTVESLAHQVEMLTLSRRREARRARDVAALATALQEVASACEELPLASRDPADRTAAAVAVVVERLRALAKDAARIGRDGVRDANDQQLVARVARDDVRDLRMVNAAQVLEPLRRAVREVAARLGKEVDLAIEGGEVKVDRRVLDELRGPLVHLVRNAVDHGIEAAAARRAGGKPERGHLSVRVEPRGARVAILVEDDGAGLDVGKVRAAAVRKGTISEREAAALTDAEAIRLVFRSGVSTASAVTDISGRGVGLDVVHDAVTRLQGTVEIERGAKGGTRFVLDVPAALAATLGVLARVGADVVAFPSGAVTAALRLDATRLGALAGRVLARVGDEQLPFAWLAQLLGARARSEAARAQPALVLGTGASRVVVGVDEVVGQQEIVVAALGRHGARVPHYAGATVLDDGHVVPVLNAAEIARMAGVVAREAAAGAPARPRVVVADDMLTTRAAMKALLEVAGYAVLPATDGQHALELVLEHAPQLVVSDVQMPRMDGLELTRRIRATPAVARTPVVLVTSLDDPSDRAAGLHAGADGYVVKREVERGKLLDLVRQLVPARA